MANRTDLKFHSNRLRLFDRSKPAKSVFLACILVALIGAFSTHAAEAPYIGADANYETCTQGTPLDLPQLKNLVPRYSRIDELHTDDLTKMKQRKAIRVLIDYSKNNYFLEDGHFFGFEYSLLREFERFINRDSKTSRQRISLEFIPMPFSELIPALLHGVGDIVGTGMAVQPNSIAETAYTDPYIEDIRHAFVTNSAAPPIESVSDLAGRRIYVQPAIVEDGFVERVNGILLDRGLKPMRIVDTGPMPTQENLMEMIDDRIIDLTATRTYLAEMWRRAYPNLILFNPEIPLPKTRLAWIVRKDNPRLKEALNRFVRRHKKGTRVGNIYFKRYFEDTNWIEAHLDKENRGRLSKYAPLFKKYAKRYDFDWRLLAAIAYQESHLNPNSRSRKGAVGLMQVLPSTAKDRHVGIENFETVEDNIHAGTKYLAFLRKRYFSTSKIDKEEQTRFALAAYNAGPKTILRCRNLAEKLGYDDNRWFNNCELAALRLHVNETVKYVTNVNKYFLAYRMSETLDCLKQQTFRQFLSRQIH